MAMKQMDKVSYFNEGMYIRIHTKNLHLIKEQSNLLKLLIWTIKNEIVDQYQLMFDNNLIHYDDKDYEIFIKNILTDIKYKVYLKVNDCGVDTSLQPSKELLMYCNHNNYSIHDINRCSKIERFNQNEFDDIEFMKIKIDNWVENELLKKINCYNTRS